MKITTRREKLRKLQQNRTKLIQKFATAKVKKWKKNLLKQHGRGRGKWRIDRGAEDAVYKAIQENLVAHERCKGTPECGYIEGCITARCTELPTMSSLIKNGKNPVKSAETVRSWGKAKNAKSIQVLQHRGKGLWCCQKPQKKYVDAHPNIHYNRAHIKN